MNVVKCATFKGLARVLASHDRHVRLSILTQGFELLQTLHFQLMEREKTRSSIHPADEGDEGDFQGE